ncbi:MAG: lecithin retinol acyltransferase family protein [Gemmatales bacterium]|nr:lecithin retinol acyltransferase family protein [Gemmatales bacterium]
MAKGDHLVVPYGLYTHHGIDIGDGTVVTLSKERNGVVRIPFSEFSDGRTVFVREYDKCYRPNTVVSRALRCVGRKGYHLLYRNCEHFATWCKTGRFESPQVRTVMRRLVAVKTKLTVKTATKVLAKNTSKLIVKQAARVATPSLIAADVVQLGVEIAACNSGIHPSRAALLGRGAGLITSVGIGAAVGGLPGAIVAGAVWAIGELFGELICS